MSQGNLKSHQVPKTPSQQLLGASPGPQPHSPFQVPGPFSATSAYTPFTSRTWASCAWQVYACVRAKSLELHPTLCDPMDYSLPGSSVHGFLQARIQEWVAMPSSRSSSPPKDQTRITMAPPWETGSLPLAPPGKPHTPSYYLLPRPHSLQLGHTAGGRASVLSRSVPCQG